MSLENEAAQPTTETAAGSEPASAPSPSAQAELPLQTPSPAPAAQPAKPSLDDELDAIWESAHGEKAGQPAKQEAAPAEEPKTETVSTDQPAKAAPEPDQSPAIAAPHSWSADAKAKWASVPPEVQQYIVDRDTQVTRWISQAGQSLKAYEPIGQVFDEFRRWVPQGQEAQVVQNLFRAQAMLDHDPIDGIKRLAEVYNVDLSKIAAPSEPQKQDNLDDLFRDPRVDRLLQEQAKSEQALRYLNGQIQAREQAEKQSRYNSNLEAVNKFAAAKQDWDAVAEDVIQEVQVLQQANSNLPIEQMLDKAYERARWANPDVRKRILEDQRLAEQKEAAEKAKKAADEAAAKAAAAKKHQSLNQKTGASASTPVFDGKWNDDAALSAIYDRHVAGTNR